ncbi:MAG: hypothetical protein HKP59_11295 [Lutibacter sp.]|uniref:hypothetical protein n=1 Tax=Lutibacter sp. TaxID=1925666 RepID=UPI0017969E3A|nr:hypothetical protein [Lutibacter sp.]MBT8318197.1 hypothetical protein [Lutibacter sp.]NNJ59057.1 hypothetical protein [Lutibacter sp.]
MKLKINKIWKTLAVVLVITTSACGQQRGGQSGPPALPTAKKINTMVSDLSDDLLLSDEQETQVLELYTKHFEEVEDKTSSRKPDRNEMEALKNSLENDIKALLTNDQKKLYTTYLKNNSSKKREKKRKN